MTDPIYNDTVCVSKTSPYMDENLKTAIQTALINIGNAEEGKAVIDQTQCVGCGLCKSLCAFDAIKEGGAVK